MNTLQELITGDAAALHQYVNTGREECASTVHTDNLYSILQNRSMQEEKHNTFQCVFHSWSLPLVLTCARRALKDSFSREMLFSTTSSLTRLSLCWTCSSCVRMSSDSSTESWACRINSRLFFIFPSLFRNIKTLIIVNFSLLTSSPLECKGLKWGEKKHPNIFKKKMAILCYEALKL